MGKSLKTIGLKSGQNLILKPLVQVKYQMRALAQLSLNFRKSSTPLTFYRTHCGRTLLALVQFLYIQPIVFRVKPISIFVMRNYLTLFY